MTRTLHLHPNDNILICLIKMDSGDSFDFQGRSIETKSKVMAGHKIAVVNIRQGEKVYKYGMPIGSASEDIHPGDHVHSHNLKSDYQISPNRSI